MSIELYCQHCGQHLKIPDQYAGQIGICKNCGKKIRVPGAEFELDLPQAPSRKPKDIPYNWIGATAAVMTILGLGAYAFLGKDSAAPPPAANLAGASPAVEARTSSPSPDSPTFPEGRKYVSLAIDTESAFTLSPEDMSFDIGEIREYVVGPVNLGEKRGFAIRWDSADTFDFRGDTFHTLRFVQGANPSGGFNEYAVMRNDGYSFYHFADDDAPRFFIKFPLKPGMRWTHDVYHFRRARGMPERQAVTQHYYADAEETVETPAGTFKCVRVLMGNTPPQLEGPNVITHWYAEGLGGFVQVRMPNGNVFILTAHSKP